MGKGYILVRLFKFKDALPNTKGKLIITNAEDGEIVYEKDDAFDISGRSEFIEVITPEKKLSQQPYEEGVIPYGIYNIDILPENFEEVIIDGVSVFEDITSIQNVEIGEEEENNGLPKKIIIPPEQLVLNAKRDKQVGSMVQPLVLERPYIPEFIVVHLGPPSSAAENVTVGFVDYIKNVASSEIYPTWPEESLKANIYCQISFALNRIYTEWYRNKGYSFQITNSTAYDQYFIKGRNIFDNISKIVDEIFSEYIITIGNKTPFFAQYCNGTTVKCDGLSQWGTVDLANAGMKALGILQYYFGYDKTLVRATMIEGIPESYPGTPLRLNDENNNVKVIQKQLNRISKNFPAIPKIPYENGKFDKITEDAVKVFQKVFNLTQDGIVGRATWYRISSIYVGVKRLAELDQEPEIDGENPPPDSGGEYPGYLLKYGSRGEKVKEVQNYLSVISKSYNIPSIKADGIFGQMTKDTVIAFQRLFGLSPDGVVGLNTWNKIYEIYKGSKKSNVEEQIYSADYPGYVLKENLYGDDVRWVQTYLNAISEFYKEIPKIKVDGIFKKKTKNAVINFQNTFGLNADGKIGVNDWKKLISVYNSLDGGQNINKSDILYDYPGFDLELGDQDGYVTVFQKYVNVLAKNNYISSQIEENGVFDKRTENSVKELQEKFGLKVTGVVDKITWDKTSSLYEILYIGKGSKRNRK
ncbi:spore cortex-lytic protein [Clostridium botulinum]|uniref:peptidoglycan-binding protein n=1 Tax=Clostridium botulinum TaxID=1491 RepID=UPI00036AFF10|nr:peptidoglycan-binding protein [Clostridium botulinum]MBN1036600.1 spore cortex-lytic protein [Clostridium botulinum]MBN1043293.1 spore cortex-lytic protein [Clostridium botulinum]MBY6915074.1 peptidoglycan-binding protein [Clostridium botulinum]NFG28120.1 spore cortex-lytic protein [Clostridium botulinum]NFL35076.1 spore cortex-lytic protein [Clostridium botulinum]